MAVAVGQQDERAPSGETTVTGNPPVTVTTATPPTATATTPTSPNPYYFGRSRTFARGGRLARGQRLRLLRVREVGVVRVRCNARGRPSATFMKDRTEGASSDLMIDFGGEPRTFYLRRGGDEVALPNPGGPNAFYSLRLAETASAEALVATITIAIGTIPADRPFACSASAQAVVTDGGTTAQAP